jgi:Protein of unknown function (DUF4232)
MTDFEDRLRQTLRGKAVGVPPKLEVPPGLTRRASARIARNVSAIAVAIGIVAVGTITGVHALNASNRKRPAASPRAAPPCQAINLSGGSKLRATDPATREGFISVVNDGGTACSLQGPAVVRILNKTGFGLSLGGGSVEPFWMVRGTKPPPGWPVVTLKPADRAEIHVEWIIWCGEGGDPASWAIDLPGTAGSVTFPIGSPHDIPICVDGGRHPTLKVGPFEPYSS